MPEFSPFIAPFAEQICRLLSLYGGGIVSVDGTLRMGVSYLRREGAFMPRIVHVEDVDTREPYVFVLDEVTGSFRSGKWELWPLAATVSRVPEVDHHLRIPGVIQIVEAFLSDLLPSARPSYAQEEHLRRQVRWKALDPRTWDTYWECAERSLSHQGSRSTRTHANVWISRKRLKE